MINSANGFVLLLLFFFRAILLAIGFFGEFYQRAKLRKQFAELLEVIHPENVDEQLRQLPSQGNIPILCCLEKLLEHREKAVYCERLLANYEVDVEKELGRSRALVKLEPMLGLMGTLIPMGSALVGLGREIFLLWPIICKWLLPQLWRVWSLRRSV